MKRSLVLTGATAGPLGVGLLAYVLQEGEVDLPDAVLWALGVLAVLMILYSLVVGVVALVGWWKARPSDDVMANPGIDTGDAAEVRDVTVSQVPPGGVTSQGYGVVINPINPRLPPMSELPVVDQLTRLLGHAVELMDKLYDSSFGVLPRLPMTTHEDIVIWEMTVADLLRPYPLDHVRFTNPLPDESSIVARASSESEDRRRLRIRMAILESIIAGLMGLTR